MEKLYYKGGKSLLFRRIRALQEKRPLRSGKFRKRKTFFLNPEEKKLVDFLRLIILEKIDFIFESIFRRISKNEFNIIESVNLDRYDIKELSYCETTLLVRIFYNQMNEPKQGLNWYLFEAIRRHENEVFLNN